MKTPANTVTVQIKLALTRHEAARALGVSAITIDRLADRGLLTPSRATRRPLYAVAEVERFLFATRASVRVHSSKISLTAAASATESSKGQSNNTERKNRME
jgi:DNA-binding transcriptional MerR regulator